MFGGPADAGIGVKNDTDLRDVDELNHQAVLARDAMDLATKPIVSAAWARWRGMGNAVKGWTDRWQKIIDSLDKMILQYQREQKELASRQQAEIERAVEEERQRKAAEAREALRNGDMAAAQEAMRAADSIAAPVVLTARPVLDNTFGREEWVVEVTDPAKLIKAIAAGSAPAEAIKEWNLLLLKREASRRGGLPEEWGVSAKQEDRLSHRR